MRVGLATLRRNRKTEQAMPQRRIDRLLFRSLPMIGFLLPGGAMGLDDAETAFENKALGSEESLDRPPIIRLYIGSSAGKNASP